MQENRPTFEERSSFENDTEVDFNNGQITAENNEPTKMPKSQIMLISFLGFLGVLVLILGFWQMKNVLKIPWPGEIVEDSANSPYAGALNMQESEDVLALKNKDSDQDGLTDYDELKIYSTSPYLADSDSDGLDDKQEIDKDSDPNCPQGEVCYSFSRQTFEQNAAVDQAQTYIPTADELRQILLDSGQITQEQLALFSDQELVDFYLQMMEENPEFSQQLSSGVNDLTDIYNYTPEQIRETLRQQGIDEEVLNQVSDEQLLDLYQQALDEVSNSGSE